MAYGLGNRYDMKGNILVYDLGEGTFDVSILKVEGGKFDVLSTKGNTHLGGQGFTNRLYDYDIKEFKDHEGVIFDNEWNKDLIRQHCEKAKGMLSTRMSYDIPYNSPQVHTVTVRRAIFEEINEDLFTFTLPCITDALRDASLDASQIDEIVLTGESTRIPKIQEILRDYFKGKKLMRSIAADQTVAHGAAIQAAILSGVKSPILSRLVTTDITPLSLEVETNVGDMTVVVKRNSKIPLKIPHNFTTTRLDNQTCVRFPIYEGEGATVKENTFLGCLVLENIPPAPRGVYIFSYL